MKKIILVLGDPNSINSEIIYKVWRKSNKNIKKNIFLIGNYKLLVSQLKKLNLKIKIKKIQSINDKTFGLKILDIPLKFKNPFKISSKASSKYVIKSLSLAHNICIKNKLGGFINCPIDKKLLNSTKVIGVTEFLAKKNKIRNNSEVMMIYNKKLAVVPLTTHINISKVAKNINHQLLLKKLTTLNNFYRKLFKKKPKICLLGLNPHNGELLKSSEEIKILIPAITRLKRLNLNISGPHVADTIFIKNYKNYDVVVGMYHDQVLAPFKAMFNFDAINITLGLNYIRVSPDHGTAVDLVRKNKADYTSLLKCVNFMKKIA
tara:strand:- start:155 stop:1111 length:957 start_codon:yes stop_codon:yes gene_type:complete